MPFSVIPTPQKVELSTGIFTINKATVILKGNDSEKLNYSFNKLKSCLLQYKISPEVVYGSEAEIKLIIVDKNEIFNVPEKFINQAYTLEINNKGITIKSTSYRGIFYGIMTLIQLIERSDNKLNCCKITDYPNMLIRGISDDISRGQVSTLDNFKKIIENIARYKMNTYMPYIEDVIELEGYPTIGVNRGSLTKKEIKELHKFANENFIEIIPIFQTLGHYENILTQPEFVKYAEFPGAASLDVSNPQIYPFLESMLKQVFELFPSEYINIGADESYDVGLGNSKPLAEKSSLAEIHLQHYLKVYDICKKQNKKVMMYSDILLNHPEIIERLPKDIIPVDWHYRPERDYKSTVRFNKVGLNYIVSPTVWNFVTAFPINYNAFPNIKNITVSGIKNNSIGMINSNWGDYGAETFKELIYLGYAYSAACSWNINDPELDSFSLKYFTDFFNNDNSGISEVYHILSEQLNTIVWHEMWRHPALPVRTPGWYESNISRLTKNAWINNSIPILNNLLNSAETKVKRNNDHLKVLRFMVNLTKYFALKTETTDEINLLINGKSNDKENCIKLIDLNLTELKKLQNEYKDIWISYYKPDNLNMIMDKFDFLTAFFEETKLNINNNTLVIPVIPSKWIYYSTSKDSLQNKVTFTKEFDINDDITSAKMQLLGDSYVKLKINGNFIGQIYARRSLSLIVDYRRILYTDITKYLKTGKNIIEVETENFNKEPNAGLNFIAEIKTKSGINTLISDESWVAKPIESKMSSKNSVCKEYPYTVVAPNFNTDRTSKIER
ncbi:MAG TPA: glycoside hydrolase family 20 zincin-like fold domain-containing protein [Melioribacteraceae bacterium]|nr:glycoside hydrolase family 20 zincin-like fold domain-containing protein [Melioribacteraceae bacterium]